MHRELLRIRDASPVERTLALPLGATRIVAINKTGRAARLSFVSGVVADGGGEEFASTAFDSGQLSGGNRKLYYAADIDGTIIDVYVEHNIDRTNVSLGAGWSNGFGV